MISHPSMPALSGKGKGSVRREGKLKGVQLIPSLNHQGQGCRECPRVCLLCSSDIVTVTALGYLS